MSNESTENDIEHTQLLNRGYIDNYQILANYLCEMLVTLKNILLWLRLVFDSHFPYPEFLPFFLGATIIVGTAEISGV